MVIAQLFPDTMKSERHQTFNLFRLTCFLQNRQVSGLHLHSVSRCWGRSAFFTNMPHSGCTHGSLTNSQLLVWAWKKGKKIKIDHTPNLKSYNSLVICFLLYAASITDLQWWAEIFLTLICYNYSQNLYYWYFSCFEIHCVLKIYSSFVLPPNVWLPPSTGTLHPWMCSWQQKLVLLGAWNYRERPKNNEDTVFEKLY